MPQDGLLDHHKVLPRQDNSAGQAGVDTGDTGMVYNVYIYTGPACSQVNLTLQKPRYMQHLELETSRQLEHVRVWLCW